MILLVHPDTGAAITVSRDDHRPFEIFKGFVLAGYRPVGPKAQALADKILAGR